MEEEETKLYEIQEVKPGIVERRLVVYGTLDLDMTKRYTYADYLSWLDDRRMELIDGYIHVLPTPNTVHARTSVTMSFMIGSFIHNRKDKSHIYHAPFDVRFPFNNETDDDKIYNVVQPDICVISDLSKLDERGCCGAPDLIVEILSNETMIYDWNYKFNLYEAAGVKEYWIIDPEPKIVDVFLLKPNGKFDDGTEYKGGQKAPVHIFEGLEIDLNELS